MNQPAADQDHETRVSHDDHQALRLWLRLLTCTSLIENELRLLLRNEFDSTLPRFDLLAQLERSPDGLSMGELSKRMMVSGGNVTGIVSQLVDEGLISRTPKTDNRRTFIVKLTPEGRRYFKKMARQHERWIVRLLDGIDSADMTRLMSLLSKLKVQLKKQTAP